MTSIFLPYNSRKFYTIVVLRLRNITGYRYKILGLADFKMNNQPMYVANNQSRSKIKYCLVIVKKNNNGMVCGCVENNDRNLTLSISNDCYLTWNPLNIQRILSRHFFKMLTLFKIHSIYFISIDVIM